MSTLSNGHVKLSNLGVYTHMHVIIKPYKASGNTDTFPFEIQCLNIPWPWDLAYFLLYLYMGFLHLIKGFENLLTGYFFVQSVYDSKLAYKEHLTQLLLKQC